jgi:ParB/RepB/Spo0J family partition protein
MKTKPAPAKKAPTKPTPKTPGKTPAALIIPLPEGTRKKIPTALIDPHPDNRKIDPKSCRGLAASMKLFGQIQPAVVRTHPTKKGRFQLGAGERRFHAASINGTDLDCLVCTLTDDQMAGLLVIENHQRENPDARHEATQIRRFTQANPAATPQQIAAMLGREEHWVKRRLRLLDLTEPVHTAWTDPKHDIHALSIASMELVATLSPELQTTFLKDAEDAYEKLDHAYVVSYLESLSCQLKDVTWLENPATFIPGCGPGCATSSAAADLFSHTEFADSRASNCAQCLNEACFFKRKALARVHAWQVVLEKAPEGYYAVTDKYSDANVTLYDGSILKPKYKGDFHGWKSCKKTDPDAKPFIEESSDTVKLTWKKPPAGATSVPLPAGETAIKTPEESLQASIDRLQGKRYTLLLDELRDHVTKAPLPDFGPTSSDGITDGIIALAASFGTISRLETVNGSFHGHDILHDETTDDDDETLGPVKTSHGTEELNTAMAELTEDQSTEKPTPWDNYRRFATFSQVQILWRSIRQVLSNRLRDRSYTDRKSDLIKPEFINEMKEIATLTGFDFDAAYLRAANATKLPAALKDLDPVTLAKK